MNITPQSVDSNVESWRDYVRHILICPQDESLWDELKQEEQSLYENGYISAAELYFGKNVDETGE